MNDSINKRRSFIKIMGLGALVTATASFAKGRRSNTSSVTLSDEQKDTLFFIFQEEKVARDVYITLGKLYPDEKLLPTFNSQNKSIFSQHKYFVSATV
jgi:hypothetical protein